MKNLNIAFALFLFSTFELFARAGGGGGSFFRGLFKNPIAFLIMIIVIGIIVLIIRIKILRTRQRLKQFEELDSIWNKNEIEKKIGQTFYKVQNAWNNDDLEPIKEFLTDKMIIKLRFQLDYYKKINKRNILEQIEFKSAKIISARDYKDNSKDTFTAIISGSMIDYDLNLKTGKKYGESKIPKSFSEYWIFKRYGDNWLLDDIKH